MRLYEKYRPKTLDDVVGQEKAVRLLRRLNLGGQALWLAGPSGSGKTSLARIIAAGFADPLYVEEMDAQDVTLDFLRNMERSMEYRAMGRGGKAWIINEVHGLRGPVLSRLLTLLEAVPDHCCVIFTTTFKGQETLFQDHGDTSPLLSRCVRVPMAYHTLAAGVASPTTKAFAQRALTIARAEGLDGKPLSAYEGLAHSCGHNLRLMLSEIAAGVMLD